MLVKKVREPRFLRAQMRWDILDSCRDEAFSLQLRGQSEPLRVGRISEATRCASSRNRKRSGEKFFHAQAYFSTQSPQPLEDARLPQPHEDQERRRGALAQACQRPQACLGQRGLSRLDLPFPSPQPGRSLRGRHPRIATEWRYAGGKIRLAQRPSAETR